MRLFPTPHLHTAAGEEIGLAACDVIDLLHIVGVTGIGRDGRKADHHIVKRQLLAGQLVHRILELFGQMAVHPHLISLAEIAVCKRGLVAVGVDDVDARRRRIPGQLVDLFGAVIGKAEEGRFLIRIGQADARILRRLHDLLAGGELRVLVGHIPATAVAVRKKGMHRRIEVIFATDIQVGIVVDVDELGAENALPIVVIDRLPRHEQLQELVAAGADGADLRDLGRLVEHRAEAGDAALDLALDQQVGGAESPLRAGVLLLRGRDVVDHDAHDPVVAAACRTGQKIRVVVGQGHERRALRQAGSRHGIGRRRSRCRGRL